MNEQEKAARIEEFIEEVRADTNGLQLTLNTVVAQRDAALAEVEVLKGQVQELRQALKEVASYGHGAHRQLVNRAPYYWQDCYFRSCVIGNQALKATEPKTVIDAP